MGKGDFTDFIAPIQYSNHILKGSDNLKQPPQAYQIMVTLTVLDKPVDFSSKLHQAEEESNAAEEHLSDDDDVEIVFADDAGDEIKQVDGPADCEDEDCEEEDCSESEEEDENSGEEADDEGDECFSEDDFLDSQVLEVPFWFGFQDPDQVEAIVQSFSKSLGVEKQRNESVRAPPPFVGRVRSAPLWVRSNEPFTTLDFVEVFLDVPWQQLGSILTPAATFYTTTTWDEDGVPVLITILSSQQYYETSKRLCKSAGLSVLYSTPKGLRQYDFRASRSVEPLTNGNPCTFDGVIPRKARGATFEVYCDLKA
jgi:hypothetical protein